MRRVHRRTGCVERVLAQGETKSSVLLAGGFQADLRLVPSDSRGAAMQYFTGSKAHNIALRDRAIGHGPQAERVRRVPDIRRRAASPARPKRTSTRRSGLAWIPPELREDRGEIEAAEAGTLPRLIDRADLRGDLHMHTTATDGKDSIEAMAEAARDAGLEYIAITDHSQGARDGERPRRAAGARARRPHPRPRRPRRRPAAGRHRVRHPRRRLARSGTTTAWPPSTSSSPRSIRRSPWSDRR